MATSINPFSWIKSKFTNWVGKRREKAGLAGVILFIFGVGFRWWQGVDFLAGKRQGIEIVVGSILDFLFSPLIGYSLMVVGAGIVVGLHVHDTRQRQHVPPPPASRQKQKPRLLSSTRTWTEVDEDGVERQHATVSPDVIESGSRIPRVGGPEQYVGYNEGEKGQEEAAQNESRSENEDDSALDLKRRLLAASQAILSWHAKESRWWSPVMPSYMESTKVSEFYDAFGARVESLHNECKGVGQADPELDRIIGRSTQTLGDVRHIGIKLGALAEKVK